MIVILLIIIIALLAINICRAEKLTGCTYCDSYTVPDGPIVQPNPYVWPYSGTSSPDDIRILEKDRGVNPNAHIPLVSYSVADHAVQTN